MAAADFPRCRGLLEGGRGFYRMRRIAGRLSFFSSRRRHTRFDCDWSSDVCSSDLPVVVLTTSKAEEDVLKSYELHANCYVTKPVDLEKFIQVVQSIDRFWLTVVTLPPAER